MSNVRKLIQAFDRHSFRDATLRRVCVSVITCMCVCDSAMVAVAPADPGFSGPLSSLLVLPLAPSWWWTEWQLALTEFRHARWHLLCFIRLLTSPVVFSGAGSGFEPDKRR